MQKYGTDRQAIDDNILRRMRFARWITNATKTHVILTALPLPQWFRQHASRILLHVLCLSCYNVDAVSAWIYLVSGG